ncbi:MAG TPA: sigma-70 family RNA polymerase sigma factor [Dongiaceae bacterium]|nr:sigma-70 family RNA polymerase sigma factor [Dongiaceae bacterium]
MLTRERHARNPDPAGRNAPGQGDRGGRGDGSGRRGQGAIVNPRNYLYRIAANLAVDHQRHENHGVEVCAEPDRVAAVADPAPSPESIVAHRGELRQLLQAIDRLPPRCREVFLLTKLHGLSYAEVAVRLGISKNTVMVHMTNALAQLADYRR